MKKILIVLSVIVLSACNSREHKAKILVQDFLKTDLDDYKRYEPVSWGKLEKVVNVLDSDRYYLKQKETVERFKKYVDGATDSSVKQGAEMRYSIEKTRLDSFVAHYQNGFAGYKIEHKYRAPNKISALELHDDTFLIDKDFKSADYDYILVP